MFPVCSAYLFCHGLGSEFRLNKNNMRFLNAYLIGYWSDGQTKGLLLGAEGDNTPSIEIGRCTPL
jgi:hypothetical protein